MSAGERGDSAPIMRPPTRAGRLPLREEVEQRNRGRVSGVEVDFHYWQTFTFRNGKATASCMAQTRAEALEAVGLRE